MASFEDILSGLGGDLDVFEGKFYEFLKAKKAENAVKKGDDKEPEAKPEKKRKSSPGNAKVKAELEEEVKVAVKAAAKADKEAGKRVTRATKAYVSALKDALTNVGIPCDDEKVFKKHWDKFRGHVNDMPEDDYKKHPNLTDHMRDFANLMKGESEEKDEAQVEAEKKVEAQAEAEKPKKKGGRKPKVEAQAEAEKKGDDKEPEHAKAEKKVEPATGGGAANVEVTTLTLAELMERCERLKMMRPGVFFDPESGKTVEGPKEGSDEDVVEEEIDGKTYAIGVKTGIVYETIDGKDVIVGFRGAGKFKHM